MITAGVDIGSVAAKAVLYDRDTACVLGSSIVPTGWNHKQAFENSLLQAASASLAFTTGDGGAVWSSHTRGLGASASADLRSIIEKIQAVCCTGYGRVSLKSADFVNLPGPAFSRIMTPSEISCHAKGACHSFPESRGVIDIGGQDSKAIQVDQYGNVSDFIMNDKCAAGTGRFIQMVSGLLEVDLETFSELAVRGKPVSISSMCAVFAESEIIGLLARQFPPEDIAAGVILSVARRTAGLSSRMRFAGPCVFTGGLAASRAMVDSLTTCLGSAVLLPPQPQLNGALGAALLAADSLS